MQRAGRGDRKVEERKGIGKVHTFPDIACRLTSLHFCHAPTSGKMIAPIYEQLSKDHPTVSAEYNFVPPRFPDPPGHLMLPFSCLTLLLCVPIGSHMFMLCFA